VDISSDQESVFRQFTKATSKLLPKLEARKL
jgi:hypothetical protein